jgi:uncharacterized protein YcfL
MVKRLGVTYVNRHCWALLGFATMAAAGCASTHPADVDNRDDPYRDKGRIQWNSSNLKSVLTIDKAVSERTSDGLLRIRLILRNKTKQDIVVDVHTVFTDKQGFEKQTTPWEPVVCAARTQKT